MNNVIAAGNIAEETAEEINEVGRKTAAHNTCLCLWINILKDI